MKKNVEWFYIILSVVLLSFTLIACDLGNDDLINNKIVKIYYDNTYSTSGNPPVDSNEYAVGQSITIKGNDGNLQRTGYQFQGWVNSYYYDYSTITYLEGEQIKASINDIHLHAKWSQNQLTVSFDTNDGEAIPSITRYSNGYIFSLPIPIKEGEIFAGWYENDSFEGKSITSLFNLTDNIILYAKWIKGTINPILKFSLLADNTYEVFAEESHSVKTLTIPPYYQGKSVTVIRAHGFESSDFETLVIPDSVESIGDYAFENNSSLTSLSLGSGLKKIGRQAFKNSDIKVLIIPDSVESIGNDAFENNSSLTSLSLGSGLKEIKSGTFMDTKISTLIIPDSVESIGAFAFKTYNLNSLTNITLGSGLKKIGQSAFRYSKITSLTIPDSVESIEDGAFASNSSLTSLTLGSGLEKIGDSAFMSTKIIDLVIPDSVESIGNFAFAFNHYLVRLTLGSSLKQIGSSAFSITNLKSINIPNKVQFIGDGAFDNNSSLTSLTLGSSLEQIGANAFKGSAIETLVIPDSVEKIWERAFYDNNSLKNLTLGSNLNYIGSEAFYNLKDVVFTIPKNVETINSEAFFSTKNKTITCQTISKPLGWVDDWYGNTNATINWNTN